MTWPSDRKTFHTACWLCFTGGGSKPARCARATLYASVAQHRCYRGIRKVRLLAGGLHAWHLRGYPVNTLGTRRSPAI